jgi:hypothetical protein
MKKTIQHSLSVFLAAVVLTSSSGLFLNKMVCLMSGKSMLSFSSFDACYENPDEELASKCCDFSQLLLTMKIDANGNGQHFSLKPLAYFLPVKHDLSRESFRFALKSVPYHFADLPPPKSTAAQLALFQVYLI